MATSMKLFDFLSHSTNHLMVIVDDDLGCSSSPSSAGSSPASSPHTAAGCFSSYNNINDDDHEATSPQAGDVTGRSGRALYVVSELDNQETPARKGLSRHFSGKSQSFTSLANARCLQDLIKPTRKMPPSSKTMRSCKSYAAGLDGANNGPHSPKGVIAKRPIRNSSSGLFHHHNGSRPPMHPHSSGNLARQAMLYA